MGVTPQRRGRGGRSGDTLEPKVTAPAPTEEQNTQCTRTAAVMALGWEVTNRDGGPCAHSCPSRAWLKTNCWNPGNGNTHKNLRIGSASLLLSHQGWDKRRVFGFYGKRSFSQERLGLVRCVRLLCTTHRASYVRPGWSWQPAQHPATPGSLHTGNWNLTSINKTKCLFTPKNSNTGSFTYEGQSIYTQQGVAGL